MSKVRTKALQFSKQTIVAIGMRDKQCLFCRQGYHMECKSPLLYQIHDIMHYVNKSAGGLGIEQNGVLGCRYHHGLLDNGNDGLRPEMLERMETYLKGIYPDWQEEDLIYQKYGGMKYGK